MPRLLVVEDHPDIAALLRLVFEETWDVECAATLREGREALIRGPRFDVALIGAHLHDGDGTDFCREAKRALPSLRVAILASHRDASTEALAAGADLLLSKPFDPDALYSSVTDLLRVDAAG